MRDQFTEHGVILENALAFQVNRFYQASRRAMYRAFAEHGVEMTPEQWLVLARLWERDGRSQAELADATTRDAPTISRIVDSMVAHGLVARAVDPDDARARRVVLTPAGRDARATLLPVARRLVARAERGIPERDLEVTRRTLRRLVDNLG